MDVLFLLHADHEQNASTSTVRLAGSSDANPFACIAAGVASLWGPSHGGANEAVVKMLSVMSVSASDDSSSRSHRALGEPQEQSAPSDTRHSELRCAFGIPQLGAHVLEGS